MRPRAEALRPDPLEGAYAPSGWSLARQDVAIVLWLSLLVAAVATMCFFAAFDPVAIGVGTPIEPWLRDMP